MRASALAAVVAARRRSRPRRSRRRGPSEESTTTSVTRGHVTLWHFAYRSHTGAPRGVWVVLPKWYGPALNPTVKLVISPHGRGLDGRANANLWGGLPAKGSFAVISPDGQGRRLGDYSWGSPGQIADLARMPAIARAGLPWLRIDARKIYAFGGSMGGQEALLLLARHPRLLAGVAAFDAVSDFAQQYRSFGKLALQRALPARSRRAPRTPPAGARALRARRLTAAAPARVRGTQPDHLRARDRLVVRAAADLVEPGRPRRHRSAAPVGQVLLEAARDEPARTDQRLRRLLDPLTRDARLDAAPVRAAALRPPAAE